MTLIRQEDAIEAIQNAYCKPCKERGDDYHEVRCRACDFDDAIIQIDAVPSAEAEWIPCSERLPEQSNDYICTIPLDEKETFVKVLTFYKGRFYEDDDEWGATFYDDVIAWMPLPTPYKGGDDE